MKLKMNRAARKWLVLSGLWVLALAGIASSFAEDRQRGDDHQRGDDRQRAPQPGYRPYAFGGSRFYFNAGVWYAPGPYGFIVTRPPFGLFVTVLPPFYTTLWLGGAADFHAGDVYSH